MIDDIAMNGEFFDPDFFVYREDADVAWRAQLLGWRCMYTPNRAGITCVTCFPGIAASCRRNQHALREEPVPDADQEHDRRTCTDETGSPSRRATLS